MHAAEGTHPSANQIGAAMTMGQLEAALDFSMYVGIRFGLMDPTSGTALKF
jgi:hypothetical protein